MGQRVNGETFKEIITLKDDEYLLYFNTKGRPFKVKKEVLQSDILSNVSNTINLGEILYVDTINGNDTTGTRGVLTSPYATISAAETDAVSGDTIMIVTDTTEDGLGKDGITYYWLPGTKNTATDTVFTDSGKGAITIRVVGGEHVVNSDYFIRINEGSTLNFEVGPITITGSGGALAWGTGVKNSRIFGTVHGDVTYTGGGLLWFDDGGQGDLIINGNASTGIVAVFSGESLLTRVKISGTLNHTVTGSGKAIVSAEAVSFPYDGDDITNQNQLILLECSNIVYTDNGSAASGNSQGLFMMIGKDTSTSHDMDMHIVAKKIEVKNGTNTGQRGSVMGFNNTYYGGADQKHTLTITCPSLIIEDDFPFIYAVEGGAETLEDFKPHTHVVLNNISISYDHDGLLATDEVLEADIITWHLSNVKLLMNSTSVTTGAHALRSDAADKNVWIYGSFTTNGLVDTSMVNLVTGSTIAVDNVYVHDNNSDLIIL